MRRRLRLVRKRRLTPVQSKVLRTLEETGEETLGCLVNTLCIRPDVSAEVPHSFASEVDELRMLGLVAWTAYEPNPMSLLEFDLKLMAWRQTRSTGEKWLSLILTPDGVRALSE
jgi:hypothetical protein